MKTFVWFMAFFVVACSKNSLSDRDAKREQILSAAETKRQELSIVAGTYQGPFTQSSGMEQNTTLKLEIKDIPVQVEGSVDTIMTPTLTGYLRFNLGATGESAEYVGFAVQKGDFNPKQNRLDLVVNNNEYKDIIISSQLNEQSLSGSWIAPASATSGTLKLIRSVGGGTTLADQMSGEYGGILLHDGKSLYQYGHITLSTIIQPPEGLRVVAFLRIIFGEWNSTEYLAYKFDPVQFNPMTGQIVLKSESSDVMFSGYWVKGELTGDWYSTYTGRLGGMKFKKSSQPSPQPGTLFEVLKGTYQGKLVNTNPQSNLPERMMVSFVTAQDLSKSNGISVSGSLRLYLGEFGSTEYMEFPFSDVQFNFFTRTLTAKVNSDYKLTLKGTAMQTQISGTISADALGEVGTFEAIKQ